MKKKFDTSPSPIISSMLAVLLLLALALIGYVLFELQTKIAAVYALLSSLLLGWLGARGRYILPSLRQYLISMWIALIPVLGTAYTAYYAGRYVAEQRGLRIAVYLCTVLSLGLFIFWKEVQGAYDLGELLALLKRSASPTSTAVALSSPTAKPTSSPRLLPSSTISPMPTAIVSTEESPLGDCLHWSEVTIELVGENICIYGDYLDISQKQDQTYVLSFSDEPGKFQVWSYPKPFVPYLPQDGSRCVVVRGWIKTSGVRPIVIIGAQGKIEPCP